MWAFSCLVGASSVVRLCIADIEKVRVDRFSLYFQKVAFELGKSALLCERFLLVAVS